MVVDIRKLSNGPGAARSVYQHGHFCVRAFHRILSYPGYTLFILFIIYLQIMEFQLYFKIRSRHSLDFLPVNVMINQTNERQSSNAIHIFDILPIKKLMVEPAIHYIRSPLAELLETKLYFTYYFPFISANLISYFHCFLSLLTIKFFSSESLFQRRIGVVIFQFRIFLDCFDGVVYRAHIKNKRYKSYYGDVGYYIDAISDVLGGVCLIIGCILYFCKRRPTNNSKYKVALCANGCPSSSSSDGGSDEADSIILNFDEDQTLIDTHSTPRRFGTYLSAFEANKTVLLTIGLFALRYSLSAIFWDRSVHAYEDLLDSPADTKQKRLLQSTIVRSPLTILIFYLWRYLCALSVQDYLLLAIFSDRTWEFLQRTNAIGWSILLLTIFLTELHINQLRSLFSIMTTN